MNMKSVNGVLMMSSSEIAMVTEKEPKHVVRDIKAMLEQLGIYSPNLDHDDFKGFFISYKDYCGRNVIDEIWLNEDLSMTLITGYDPKRRLALIEQWQDMKRELSQPRISDQPVQPEIGINPDFAALTRTVAEATAAGVMKSILETTGIQAVVHINATVSALPAALPEDPTLHHIGHVTQEDAEEPEYVPVHKVSWATGLSDPTCRRLVTFSDLPNCHIDGVRGLCVHREFFMAAVEVLIKESTPPAKGRKRWHHPEFGGFELRKDPNEILGGNHGE
ncbi:Rha family transcriptional regulator [Klebsiella oxytoca]|uniref:Rha family transcriptional regulator n=1 Tax=Klebsiella oxytoca TaxID=571 RepID=UPI001DC6D730|nr:Rha family transcriptional regulator [Klebsiella oxytoca]MDM4082323.1 Rha family transcriptional regulator [Klebsiella oxytoca]MDM4099695.1 Rha family transcriptional regulator [Klebsiella oxytoca]MDM4118592.1 Rha family transcriptional regulator [Klebsiella oxytoca]MDM4128685.1 Rha family transcriptional regulator [Klebsiella oxytoca]MDM4135997.1 Rha family transcriptional regulator [Klebsiella oxytoca]